MQSYLEHTSLRAVSSFRDGFATSEAKIDKVIAMDTCDTATQATHITRIEPAS
jgi:hypothetical protein